GEEGTPLGHRLGPGGQGRGEGRQRRGGQPGEQQRDVVVVALGVRPQGGQDAVGGLVQSRRSGGEQGAAGGREGGETVLDVAARGLDQAVGVEHQGGARRHRRRRLLVEDA